MPTDCVVFVEGSGEKFFLDAFLKHVCLSNIETEIIGGGVSKLHKAQPTILRRHDEGKRVAIILDADADAGGKRVKFEEEKERLGLPVNRVFLIPDDERPGCLETILEEITATQHRDFYECFSRYEECVRNLSESYRLPGHKARIYAFCEAVENGPQERKRDYGNANHWNLDAPVLDPLKDFLRGCA